MTGKEKDDPVFDVQVTVRIATRNRGEGSYASHEITNIKTSTPNVEYPDVPGALVDTVGAATQSAAASLGVRVGYHVQGPNDQGASHDTPPLDGSDDMPDNEDAQRDELKDDVPGR